jgi:hypothetical protein
VSHLCLQTVENYVDFLIAVERLLAVAGAFLVSIPHPAFFNNYKKFIPEADFIYMKKRDTVVDFNITLDSEGTIQQFPYFHRPLSMYLSALVKAGLVLTHMREIYPDEAIQALYGSPWSTPRYLLLGGSSLRGLEKIDQEQSVANRLLELERKVVL